MPELLLRFLGPAELQQADGARVDLKYDKALALLAYLAVEADRAHRRDALAGLLWPELPQTAARNNLRQALLALRQATGDREASPPFLLSNRLAIQFNAESDYWLDAGELEAAVQASEQHAHRSAESCLSCARRLEEAVALYQGPFLAEFALPDSIAFEEWASLTRERLNSLVLRALERLTRFHERRGHYERAIAYAQRQLELEPWDEPAHRRLMHLYVLQGNPAAALAQYETCRDLLAAELAVEPEEETARLAEQIREAPEGEVPYVERAVEAGPPYRLPHPATPFIGRERELAEIGRLLDSSGCRLLTLAGPGGVGKTRLALQAAADQANLFAAGIFYVNLAPVHSAALLPEAIAASLEIELVGAGPDEALLRHLRDREMLLVLDNLEHLLEETGLIAQILQRAPAVTLLATSRERLNLQGEQVFPVTGFAARPDQGEAASGQPAAQSAAVQLFVQAAQRARGDFTLSPQNRERVLRICELVGGLPLGIELAAAWTRLLTCAEIAAELERSFHFLETSWRDLPPRHRSIATVFDQSWALLPPKEQRVLAALSVFPGDFSRQAAEEVAGATLPILAALVDKSLLQRHPTGRYALHPLLSQYAAEKLHEAGDQTAARDRHLAFFLGLAVRAADEFRGADQVQWLERLAVEQDNLRAALSWAQESAAGAAVEQGLRLAAALYRYWYWRSYFREGLGWLEAFLARSVSLPADLRARALYAAGVLSAEQNDYDRAERYLQDSLSLWRQLSDGPGQAACLNSLGILAWSQQAYERAKLLLAESLALRRAAGESNLGPALNSLGLVALAQGDFKAAEGYFAEQLAAARAAGHEMGTAISQSNLGAALLEQGRAVAAARHLGEGLARFRQLGDREGIAGSLEGVAALALRAGEVELAVLLCAAAASLRDEIHAPLKPAERPRVERTLAKAHATLGPEGFQAKMMAGQRLPLEEIVALAIALCRRHREDDGPPAPDLL